jgi:hypothetical protein
MCLHHEIFPRGVQTSNPSSLYLTSLDVIPEEKPQLSPHEILYWLSILPPPKHQPKRPSRLRFSMNADELALIAQIDSQEGLDPNDSYYEDYDWMQVEKTKAFWSLENF